MSEKTDSESYKDYAHTHPVDTEPVMRIAGEGDDDNLDEELDLRLRTELEDSDNDTPRLCNKQK